MIQHSPSIWPITASSIGMLNLTCDHSTPSLSLNTKSMDSQNVLVWEIDTPRPFIKVIDFGLACSTEDTTEASSNCNQGIRTTLIYVVIFSRTVGQQNMLLR